MFPLVTPSFSFPVSPLSPLSSCLPKKLPLCFLKWPFRLRYQPAVCESSNCYTSLPTLAVISFNFSHSISGTISLCLEFASIVSTQNVSVSHQAFDFKCVSNELAHFNSGLMMLRIFPCIYVPSIYLLCEASSWTCGPLIFIELLVFILNFKSFLCILDTSPLSDMLCKYFLQSVTCHFFFILLIVSWKGRSFQF